jgi:hypothetical protein
MTDSGCTVQYCNVCQNKALFALVLIKLGVLKVLEMFQEYYKIVPSIEDLQYKLYTLHPTLSSGCNRNRKLDYIKSGSTPRLHYPCPTVFLRRKKFLSNGEFQCSRLFCFCRLLVIKNTKRILVQKLPY